MHTKKKKYTQKKCENANVVPLEKGTAKTLKKSVFPCREQQRKCTQKSKNTHKKVWKCKNGQSYNANMQKNKLAVHGIDAEDELHFEWSNTWNTKYKRN